MLNKIIDVFSRVFVGGLFIFSGLIKLNDPIGTKIKLQEYFDVFATDFGSFFEVFIPFALPIGLFLIVLEVVLGVAALINYKMGKATWILLVLMVFFTFLTFYSAYFNKVTDCGCFGDAIPLTPWQSFYKDLILIVFVLHLFWHRRRFEPMLRTRPGHFVIGGVTVISFIVGIYAIQHLPYIDFRPYKIGNSIPAEMIADEPPILEYVFTKDGETVTSQKYLMPDEGYEYVSSSIVNEKASTPAITDYQVVDPDGNDYTQETFQGAKLLFIFYDTKKADTYEIDEIRALMDGVGNQITPLVLTSAGISEFETFRHQHQLAVEYYLADATVLKAMIRSNPGVMLLKDGIVLGKWHNNDVPSADEIKALIN
ncbi:DoxX family membrane protein [Fulvivirga sp. RKSG066]|uniref:BT_3928 family protein n=1 Tax=Fulvivirga aurantia TaxID=2529383 RepID=UPI0012BD4FE5|nr:BT_3928 family protein [Fulvivirga aurantia]MTI22265.1 DoxX family membrane protein [Fulvivirga aurantia]